MKVSSGIVDVARDARNAVTWRTGRQVLKFQKSSPEILFAVGVTGVVVGTVLACRATLKVHEINETAEADKKTADAMHEVGSPKYSDADHRRDLAKIQVRRIASITKLYGPAIGVGVLSIGALRKSHNILNARNAGLMAAYAALDKGFSEYRERVLELVGPDKERELRYGSEEREFVTDTKNGPKVVNKNTVDINKPTSIYARLFTEFNPNWSPQPEYNVIFLRAQQNYANDMLRARGHVFLNEVYDMLGLDRTTAGAVVGWVLNGEGDNCIDFGIFEGQNQDGFFDFVTGREGSIMLDFNVDGVVHDKI